MKTCIILILTIRLTYTSGVQLPEELRDFVNHGISKWFAHAFLNRLEKQMEITGNQNPKDQEATVLPSFEDPLYLETWEYEFNLDVFSLLNLKGDWSFCFPKLTGLSKLSDNLTIKFLPEGSMFIGWDINLPFLNMESPYQLAVDLNMTKLFLGAHNLTGEGQFLTTVGNLNHSLLKLQGNFSVFEEKLSLDELEIDLEFENLTASAEGLQLDGFVVNLDYLTQGIRTLLDFAWSNDNQVVVTEQIRCLIDTAISNCTLLDFMRSNFGCLNNTVNPDCFQNRTEFKAELREQGGVGIDIKEIGFCNGFTKPPRVTTPDPTSSTLTSGVIGIRSQKYFIPTMLITMISCYLIPI